MCVIDAPFVIMWKSFLDDEKAALLNRYKVHEMQLPRIKYEDPIAQYYGMQRGQVVKIIRSGGVNGRHATYRVVN